ncbi:MAG: hypothetical protein IJI49_00365 [Bacilli bacterium]|nr:hypothetical protein [Bacilli bacterium]
MKYDVDCVVTLNDNKEYYLIDKNVVDGDTYYYAVEYTGDVDSMFDNEKLYFKDDNGYLVDVVDLDIIIKLKELFLNKFTRIVAE